MVYTRYWVPLTRVSHKSFVLFCCRYLLQEGERSPVSVSDKTLALPPVSDHQIGEPLDSLLHNTTAFTYERPFPPLQVQIGCHPCSPDWLHLSSNPTLSLLTFQSPPNYCRSMRHQTPNPHLLQMHLHPQLPTPGRRTLHHLLSNSISNRSRAVRYDNRLRHSWAGSTPQAAASSWIASSSRYTITQHFSIHSRAVAVGVPPSRAMRIRWWLKYT